MEIDINNLRDNLNNKLKESGWDHVLAPYINGLSFDHIMNTLVKSVSEGRRFTPKFKDTFNLVITLTQVELCIHQKNVT